MADNPTNTDAFPVLSEQATHRNGAELSAAAQAQGVFLVAVTSDGHVVDFDPRRAPDVVTTLTDGRKAITPAGTPEAIRATLACKWVMVTALPSNAADVYVGGSGVSANNGAEAGTPLSPNQSTTIPIDDATKVFLDVLSDGDGVTFTVGS